MFARAVCGLALYVVILCGVGFELTIQAAILIIGKEVSEMGRLTHRPRARELVNDKSRGPYRANGYIQRVWWSEQEIQVAFWTKEDGVMEYDSYDFDEFLGCWTERCGGVWILVEEEVDELQWVRAFLWKQRKLKEMGL